jgi:release factor glutamine methyltransferase
MPNLLKSIIHYTYRPWAIWYIKRDRTFSYNGLELEIPKGVFHPGLFFSTKLLASHLMQQPLEGKSVLELGCGSGFLSCLAAKGGAHVTATDINPKAIEATKANALRNGLEVETIESNLFQSIPQRQFDWIFINPPYYARNPKNMKERAWFAGENLEYFHQLFQNLGTFMHNDSQIRLVASEDVDMEKIFEIAKKHGFEFEVLVKKRTVWEWNYVYHLRKCS